MEMESTLTTLTSEHASQLAKARREKEEALSAKEEQERTLKMQLEEQKEEQERALEEQRKAHALAPVPPPTMEFTSAAVVPPPPMANLIEPTVNLIELSPMKTAKQPSANLIDLSSPAAGAVFVAASAAEADDLDMPAMHVPKSLTPPQADAPPPPPEIDMPTSWDALPGTPGVPRVRSYSVEPLSANRGPNTGTKGHHRSPTTAAEADSLEAAAARAKSPRRHSLMSGGAVRVPLSPRRDASNGSFDGNAPPTPGAKGKTAEPSTPSSRARRAVSSVVSMVSSVTPSKAKLSSMAGKLDQRLGGLATSFSAAQTEDVPPPPPPDEDYFADGLGLMAAAAPRPARPRQSLIPKPGRSSLIPSASSLSLLPAASATNGAAKRESLMTNLKSGLSSRLPVSRRTSMQPPNRANGFAPLDLSSPPGVAVKPPPPAEESSTAKGAVPPARGLPAPKANVDARGKMRSSAAAGSATAADGSTSASIGSQPWAGNLLGDLAV